MGSQGVLRVRPAELQQIWPCGGRALHRNRDAGQHIQKKWLRWKATQSSLRVSLTLLESAHTSQESKKDCTTTRLAAATRSSAGYELPRTRPGSQGLRLVLCSTQESRCLGVVWERDSAQGHRQLPSSPLPQASPPSLSLYDSSLL